MAKLKGFLTPQKQLPGKVFLWGQHTKVVIQGERAAELCIVLILKAKIQD